MSNQTFSALSEIYLNCIDFEKKGLLTPEKSKEFMSQCLDDAGIDWDDFIENLEDRGII